MEAADKEVRSANFAAGFVACAPLPQGNKRAFQLTCTSSPGSPWLSNIEAAHMGPNNPYCHSKTCVAAELRPDQFLA
jgi:hypothetical protein